MFSREFIEIPTSACHASTLLQLRDGGFLVCWFGGTRESCTDVAIYSARRFPSGEWGSVSLLAKVNDTAHWNPVLFRFPDGVIHLYFKVGDDVWQTYEMTSQDEGLTWSKPDEMIPGDVSGGRGPVKNKPILLSDGSILAPGSVEIEDGPWRAFVDRFENGSWHRSELLEFQGNGADSNWAHCTQGVIQPTLWEAPAGHVQMLMRSNVGCVYHAGSWDCGRTWSPCGPTELPNNNSGLDLAQLSDGTLVMLSNLTFELGRKILVKRISKDNGATWSDYSVVDEVPEGELSYPAIIPLQGNRYAFTYTWLRQKVAFCLDGE